MRRIEQLHLGYPIAGSQIMQGLLKVEGHEVGRLHVATLMKGWVKRRFTDARGPRSRRRGTRSIPTSCKLAVNRPKQVWAMHITHVPMARGFVYLAAGIDWYSRNVLACRLSMTLSADFCIEALEDAPARRAPRGTGAVVGPQNAHHLLPPPAETQLGRREEPVDDHDIAMHAGVDDLGASVRADHEERWHLALGNARREDDIDPATVVGDRQGPPGRGLALQCIAKAPFCLRRDRRPTHNRQARHCRRVGIGPGDGGHPDLLARAKLDVIAPPVSVDHEVGGNAGCQRRRKSQPPGGAIVYHCEGWRTEVGASRT
jgi:hypothetical protein